MRLSKYWLIVCLTLGILTFLGCVKFLGSNPGFQIALPIDCKLGKDCFIFHYVDTQPSSEAIDFNCGRQTYDNHTGTDFGITDLKAMEKGVKVLAVAPGKVKSVRDGIIDKLIVDQADKNEVTDRGCGNNVIVDHGDGWETRYCHLKQGSILVKPNTNLERGTPLGLVGASGLASFPHVHLTVRYQKKVIDPFTGKEAISGCKTDKKPLWNLKIDYQPTGLINAGFAPQLPKPVELWEGKFLADKLPQNSSSLVFWIHLYGIIKGDIESFTLIDPNGKVVIDQNKIVKKSYRNWVSYIGKINEPNNLIMLGSWHSKYQLTRDSHVILEVSRKVKIIPHPV